MPAPPPVPPLLAAKFHRPIAPRHLVARPARLNAGLAAGHSLTLIAAPAGYGKTTLALEVACRMAGRLDEAIEALEEAMRAAHAIDDHVTAMVAVAHLSLLWYPLGRLRRLAEKAECAVPSRARSMRNSWRPVARPARFLPARATPRSCRTSTPTNPPSSA